MVHILLINGTPPPRVATNKMNLDEQIERAKKAIELSRKREEIAKEIKIVYEDKISHVSTCRTLIDTLDSNDLEKITNLTYNLLSEKYETISNEIAELLTPKQ